MQVSIINKTFDWTEIIGKIMKDYLDAQLQSQYGDCERLMDYFAQDEAKKENCQKFIRDKMLEILDKI